MGSLKFEVEACDRTPVHKFLVATCGQTLYEKNMVSCCMHEC